jgi:hypothetical protein
MPARPRQVTATAFCLASTSIAHALLLHLRASPCPLRSTLKGQGAGTCVSALKRSVYTDRRVSPVLGVDGALGVPDRGLLSVAARVERSGEVEKW